MKNHLKLLDTLTSVEGVAATNELAPVPVQFKFDEVGIWSELKLEIVEKYGSAYTGAFANQRRLKKFYVDAFSGAGVHISKRSGEQIDGSPARALKITPPFDGFFFIDMDAQKTAHLKTLYADRSDVHIEDWRRLEIPHRETSADNQVRRI